MDFATYRKKIIKSSEHRVHKVTNSWGVKDAFNYYRKIRPRDSSYVLSDVQYMSIIRRVNNILRLLLINGVEVQLPEKMGKLELRKRAGIATFKNNKFFTNFPVDWDSTIKLWYEDEEERKKKTLVRHESKDVFQVYYNKYLVDYPNKSFYQFHTNRELKQGLKHKIRNDELDAALLYEVRHGKDNND